MYHEEETQSSTAPAKLTAQQLTVHLRNTWDQPHLSVHAKAVLTVLLMHSNGAGHCWPSLARISSQASLSKAKVVSCLAELDARSFLWRQRSQGGRRSTCYHLFFNVIGSMQSAEDAADPGRVIPW